MPVEMEHGEVGKRPGKEEIFCKEKRGVYVQGVMNQP
jgi:hypothetical protein